MSIRQPGLHTTYPDGTAERLARGLNPSQPIATVYWGSDEDPLGMARLIDHSGRPGSYSVIGNANHLLRPVTHIAAGFHTNFGEVPSITVGTKHESVCGGAAVSDPVESVEMMLQGNNGSVDMGVVMLNSKITLDVAQALVLFKASVDKPRKLESIIGASITDEALHYLNDNHDSIRVLTIPGLEDIGEDSLDKTPQARQLRGGGELVQDNYAKILDLRDPEVSHQLEGISEKQQREMVLARAIGVTAASNTVVLVNDLSCVGVGAGQPSRELATKVALLQTVDETDTSDRMYDPDKAAGSVVYSDAAFRDDTAPIRLVKAGARVILTSSRGEKADSATRAALKAISGKASLIALPSDYRGFFVN